MDSYVVGHHHFKAVWSPVIGEDLLCFRDRNNDYDPRAVGVFKEKQDGQMKLVGRVPREHSEYLCSILADGESVRCTITGRRENKRRRGLEVPCIYHVSQ